MRHTSIVALGALLFASACGGTDKEIPDGGMGGGATDDAGVAGSSHHGGTGAGGNGGSGGERDAGVVCPTAPPFDLEGPGIDACTTPILVAVGNRTRRAVTFDGMNWLDDQLDGGNCIGSQCNLDDGAFQVAFGQGYLVTASDFGIFTSADRGHTWAKAAAPAPQQWGQGNHVSDVVWTGKRFVVFSETTSFTSSDGLKWAKHDVTLAGGHLAFGAASVGANGRILAMSGSNSINISDDGGVTWKQVDVGAEWKTMAVGNNVLVGVGNAVRGYSTDNGDSWTVLKDDCSANDPARCVMTASMVLFYNGKFHFTGNNVVLESADGKDWTANGTGTGYDWSHAFFNGKDYGVGYPGSNYQVGDSPGGPWTAHTWPLMTDQGMQGLAAGRVLKK